MRDRRRSSLRIGIAVMAMMCVLGAVPRLTYSQDKIDLRLHEGEDRVEQTIKNIVRNTLGVRSPSMLPTPERNGPVIRLVGEQIGVWADGGDEVELSIVVLSHGHDGSVVEMEVGEVPSGTLYRKRFYGSDYEYPDIITFFLIMNDTYFEQWSQNPGRFWERPGFGDFDVVFTLRRVYSHCSMWAQVSGDLSGTHRGDIAYFNHFGPGEGASNEVASGTAADEGVHDVLQGFGEMTGMLEFLDAEGIELEEDARAAMEQARSPSPSDDGEENRPPSELEQFEFATRHSGDNNFGLTLTAVQHEEESNPEGHGGETGFSDSLGGMVTGVARAMEPLGAFSLGLSGKGSVSESVEDLGDIAVTSLWVAPGPRDANMESAKFFWEEGMPGEVELLADASSPGLLHGAVNARVRSDKVYDGRYLWINISAYFTAREGFLSCAD